MLSHNIQLTQFSRIKKGGATAPLLTFSQIPKPGLPRACPQRSFSVASPISARINEMIQNRMTICASPQPFFSK